VSGDPAASGIGRGDMFGAAFLYHHIKNHNILAAAQSAQTGAMAGQTT
jgi:fructose-1-phosphate kinase PfkB-like protein